jgi:hypothetical protein
MQMIPLNAELEDAKPRRRRGGKGGAYGDEYLPGAKRRQASPRPKRDVGRTPRIVR